MKRFLTFLLLFLLTFSLSAQSAKPDATKEYRAKNYKGAVDICLAEINSGKSTVDTYAILLWSLNRQKRYREAITYGNQGLKRYRDMRIIESMGVAYYYVGNYDRALANFKTYVAELPEGAFIDDVYFYMGEIYIRKGEFNNADIALSTAVHHYPKSAMWWSRLGYAREQASSYELALKAYDQALAINKNHAEAKAGHDRVSAKLNS
ncbi:MAG: tetratricopeptide repeat protein [Spirochaetia bacterium]|nr:tetratricopeptide repeat protein [Spirochaetia bacterium]MBQ3712807.1 tetratricopeptide repeat protein [Spirochaetia bacterium]MBQ6673500.1 tetratricopeptide repeat protein [Spirochaetia bacterium]